MGRQPVRATRARCWCGRPCRRMGANESGGVSSGKGPYPTNVPWDQTPCRRLLARQCVRFLKVTKITKITSATRPIGFAALRWPDGGGWERVAHVREYSNHPVFLLPPTIFIVPSPSAPADCVTVILTYSFVSLLCAPCHCLRLSLNHSFFILSSRACSLNSDFFILPCLPCSCHHLLSYPSHAFPRSLPLSLSSILLRPSLYILLSSLLSSVALLSLSLSLSLALSLSSIDLLPPSLSFLPSLALLPRSLPDTAAVRFVAVVLVYYLMR